MKHCITAALLLSSLAGFSAVNARPLCNNDAVLNEVYRIIHQELGRSLGIDSYDTLSVRTYATTPTDTQCEVTAVLILGPNAPAGFPPGVTWGIPFSINDTGNLKDVQVIVNTNNVTQGVDMTRLMQGQESSPLTADEIREATGYDRQRAECEVAILRQRRSEKVAECYAKYPELKLTHCEKVVTYDQDKKEEVAQCYVEYPDLKLVHCEAVAHEHQERKKWGYVFTPEDKQEQGECYAEYPHLRD